MRTNVLTGHAILERSDLAACLHCTGISAHTGVLILWDEDSDERVIELVDLMSQGERAELVAIHECKGMVTLFWRAYVPRRFQAWQIAIAGDVWTACHQVAGGCLLEFKEGCADLTVPVAELADSRGVETAAVGESEWR